MAEKTEQPTPKRLREARRKGQIAYSADVPAAAGFLVGVLVLTGVFGPQLAREFRGLYVAALEAGAGAGADPLATTSALLTRAARGMALVLAPVLLSLGAASLALGFAQAGFHLAPARLSPSLDKLSPAKSLGRWFSLEGLTEVLKAIVKLSIVLALGYLTVDAALAGILALHRSSASAVAVTLGEVSRSFALRAAAAFVLVAVADYWLVRRRWKSQLMMTPDEVRREHKEQEGDPLIKGQRRAAHQELAMVQIAAEVRMADAVVVNPTHLAVALRYDRETMAAPRVTAKGGGEVAREMLKLAREHEVPVVRDVPLAHALFEVQEGRYVPRELYEAIAEVLLFAARLRQAGRAGQTGEAGGAA
jgi:flagellar biosynthesis protein FlhB